MITIMTAIVASNLMCGSATSGKSVPVSFVCEQSKAQVKTSCNAVDFVIHSAGLGDFLEALDDFEKGRIVGLDIALNDPPPEM